MTDLSDWIWLIVVVFWVLVRVLPRIFRNKSGSQTKPKTQRPKAPPSEIPSTSSFGHDHRPDASPKPIEPK